jgi:hypothetical protein
MMVQMGTDHNDILSQSGRYVAAVSTSNSPDTQSNAIDTGNTDHNDVLAHLEHYKTTISPNMPTQNGFDVNSNATVTDACLDQDQFSTWILSQGQIFEFPADNTATWDFDGTI